MHMQLFTYWLFVKFACITTIAASYNLSQGRSFSREMESLKIWVPWRLFRLKFSVEVPGVLVANSLLSCFKFKQPISQATQELNRVYERFIVFMMPVTLRYLPALHRQSRDSMSCTHLPRHMTVSNLLCLSMYMKQWKSSSLNNITCMPIKQKLIFATTHCVIVSTQSSTPFLLSKSYNYSGTPLFCTSWNHNPYLPSVQKRWWRKQGTPERTTPTRSYKNMAQRHSKKQHNVPEDLPEIRFWHNIDSLGMRLESSWLLELFALILYLLSMMS